MRIQLALALAFVIQESPAADFCVASEADFKAAMDAIANSPSDAQHVKLVAGDYALDHIGLYSAGSLTVEGGYDNTCTNKERGAQRTVMHPAADVQTVSMHAFGGDLKASDFILDGYPVIYIFPQGSGNSLYMERVALVLAAHDPWPPPYAETFALDGSVNLTNVLIDADTSACAVQANSELSQSSRLDFVTIVNRGAGTALCVTGNLLATNTIIQAGGIDLTVSGDATLQYSIYGELVGSLNSASFANVTGPIEFEASNSHFFRNRPSIQGGQLAVDTAMSISVSHDITGGQRPLAAGPDRGAFELDPLCSDELLIDGFETIACHPMARGHSHHARRCLCP